ncbi:hypothetical protein FA95DRAFT_1557525 [Auriscalpium vulgare]|uniref:Uncharacterized protein n=1 Tax=Auriscalpium vulgare TaxID=40419 RepID=A0ACB8RYW9_9AGAM|nr:hypothetical protein FA95DRAFT_1557525 [Auriscalpium vulgare]
MQTLRSPSYLNEKVQDADGTLRPTERSIVARREYYSELSKLRAPMEQLPAHLDPKHNPNAPQMQFGIPVTAANIIKFTRRNQLLSPEVIAEEDPEYPIDEWTCLAPFMRHLRKMTGGCLCIQPVFDPTGQLWAIAFYDNYTIDSLKYPDAREKKIVETLHGILGTSDPPMWYWGPT